MSFLPSPENLQKLSGTEYQILEFIIKNQDAVCNMTVQEISECTYVSTASIMRFCKKIGFSGFSELKFHLKSGGQSEVIVDSTLSITDMKKATVVNLDRTANFIDSDTLDSVASLLCSDKNIHFFAKGISCCVFSYFQKYLQTLGRHSNLYEDTHIAYLNAEKMNEKDVLFVASLSGATAQILKAVQIAKANGATIIAFTKMNNNPLSTLVKYNFHTSTMEDPLTHSFDTQSRLSMYFIVDLIIKKYLIKLA